MAKFNVAGVSFIAGDVEKILEKHYKNRSSLCKKVCK